jgi:excisionase family DNA binding protein
MSRRNRRPRGYQPEPIPPDYDRLDVGIPQAMHYLGLSESAVRRLLAKGELQSFRVGGVRKIALDGLKQYRARCIARGPQFALPLKTGKRPPGRPKSQAVSP